MEMATACHIVCFVSGTYPDIVSEWRVRLMAEMLLNKHLYLDDDYLGLGFKPDNMEPNNYAMLRIIHQTYLKKKTSSDLTDASIVE